jgi:hypothetical protein
MFSLRSLRLIPEQQSTMGNKMSGSWRSFSPATSSFRFLSRESIVSRPNELFRSGWPALVLPHGNSVDDAATSEILCIRSHLACVSAAVVARMLLETRCKMPIQLNGADNDNDHSNVKLGAPAQDLALKWLGKPRNPSFPPGEGSGPPMARIPAC